MKGKIHFSARNEMSMFGNSCSPLSSCASILNKNVGVSRQPRHEAYHMIIDDVSLFASLRRSEKLGNHALLRSKNETFSAMKPDASSGVVNRLNRILDLV